MIIFRARDCLFTFWEVVTCLGFPVESTKLLVTESTSPNSVQDLSDYYHLLDSYYGASVRGYAGLYLSNYLSLFTGDRTRDSLPKVPMGKSSGEKSWTREFLLSDD